MIFAKENGHLIVPPPDKLGWVDIPISWRDGDALVTIPLQWDEVEEYYPGASCAWDRTHQNWDDPVVRIVVFGAMDSRVTMSRRIGLRAHGDYVHIGCRKISDYVPKHERWIPNCTYCDGVAVLECSFGKTYCSMHWHDGVSTLGTSNGITRRPVVGPCCTEITWPWEYDDAK